MVEERIVPKTELLRATEYSVFLVQLLPDSLTSPSQMKQSGDRGRAGKTFLIPTSKNLEDGGRVHNGIGPNFSRMTGVK